MGATAGAGWGMSAGISSIEATASSAASSLGVEKRADLMAEWVAMGAKAAVAAMAVERMTSFIMIGYLGG